MNNIMRIAKIVGIILLIPLFGNMFIDEWNWTVLDFIAMGTLLFVTGLAINVAAHRIHNRTYRIITIVWIVILLIALWTELAVDALSQLVHSILN